MIAPRQSLLRSALLYSALSTAVVFGGLSTQQALAQTAPTAAPLVAGNATDVLAGQRVTVTSHILGEQRELLIHLPQDYARSSQRYPVIVLLDGNNHFLYASGTVDFLSRNGRMPEAILVAVPTMHKRSRDLTMPLVKDKEAIAKREAHDAPAGSAEFLRFLADELLPWVDAQYRTQPYRILSGHSLGGLFSFYALLERPDAFNAYIAVSPSLWWDDRRWVDQSKERLAGLPGKHFLYFSWGDDEESIRDSSQELVDWMRKQPLPSLEWVSRYYPGDDHGTTPLRTFYDGLEKLYAPWQLQVHDPEKRPLAELETLAANHSAMLSERYGYPIPPSADTEYGLVDWLIENKRYDEALVRAKALQAKHPESRDSHGLISRILEKQGDAAGALAEYRLSLPESSEYGNVWDVKHRLETLEKAAAKAARKR